MEASIHRLVHRTGKRYSKRAVRKVGAEIVVADGLFTSGLRISPNAWPTGPSRVLNKRMSRGMRLLSCDSEKSPGPSKYNLSVDGGQGATGVRFGSGKRDTFGTSTRAKTPGPGYYDQVKWPAEWERIRGASVWSKSEAESAGKAGNAPVVYKVGARSSGAIRSGANRRRTTGVKQEARTGCKAERSGGRVRLSLSTSLAWRCAICGVIYAMLMLCYALP